MKLTVPRGELRRVLSQLAPHMGVSPKDEDEKKWRPYGRVRIAVTPEDRLVLWAGDNLTRACGSVPVVEYRSPEAPIFDLSVEDVSTILKTFRPTGSADDKSMWGSGLFEIALTGQKFHIAELYEFGGAGKELALPLSWEPGSDLDVYPDIPSAMISVLAAPIEAALESYPAREALFRILAAVHPDGHLRLIESSREALIISGTKDFTAIVPAQLVRPEGPRTFEDHPESFAELIGMLLPHVQPIDDTTDAGKTRAAITRGLTMSTTREKDTAK